MCTAMTIQGPKGNVFFGRTMDFSYPLDPELYLFPQGYEWSTIPQTHRFRNPYSYMGIGQDISPVILADGVNEKGFGAAVLYFPGYAEYDETGPEDSAKPAVPALEIVNFLLGQCASVRQAASVLRAIRIVGVKDPITHSVAPLHWILADKSGSCMIAEKMKDGLHLTDNPIGVLSNSPDFDWHMTNLRNYLNVTPGQQEEAVWGSVRLSPFGQGGGTFGLPGDYTPPSRFVRTAYQKNHIDLSSDREEAVAACFHVMEGVSIPKGIVTTVRGTSDYTQYTAFIDLSAGEYFFTTCDNSTIVRAKLSPSRDTAPVSLGKLLRPIRFERWGG